LSLSRPEFYLKGEKMDNIDELIKEISEIPAQLKSGTMDLERAELLITAKNTIIENYELSYETRPDDLPAKTQIKKARKVITKVENEIEKLRKKQDK
jgi:hypothetical protein